MPTVQWILCPNNSGSEVGQQCRAVSESRTGETTSVNISQVDDAQVGEYHCVASYLDVVEYIWNVSVVATDTGQSTEIGQLDLAVCQLGVQIRERDRATLTVSWLPSRRYSSVNSCNL